MDILQNLFSAKFNELKICGKYVLTIFFYIFSCFLESLKILFELFWRVLKMCQMCLINMINCNKRMYYACIFLKVICFSKNCSSMIFMTKA